VVDGVEVLQALGLFGLAVIALEGLDDPVGQLPGWASSSFWASARAEDLEGPDEVLAAWARRFPG